MRFAGKLAATMQMRYPYVNPPGFPRGDYRRLGLTSDNTWDAILAGERTATTRLPVWYRNNPQQLETIKSLRPGDYVAFTKGNDRMIVEVQPSELSTQQMEMASNYPALSNLQGATYALSKDKMLSLDPRAEADRKRWSELEGWDESLIPHLWNKEPTGILYQFQYKPI